MLRRIVQKTFLNSLPKDKILDWSNLKAFAEYEWLKNWNLVKEG